MLEGLLGLFVLGTFGFWALVSIAFLVMLWGLEEENGFKTTVTFFLVAGIVSWANHFNIFGLIALHWPMVLGFTALYFVFGTGWGVAKWYFYLHSVKDKYIDAKEQFLANYGVKTLDELTANQLNDFKTNYEVKRFNKIPSARDKKATILMWMSYWPISAFWTIVNDPIKKAFREIYRKISTTLQNIANNVFEDVQADFKATK